MAIKNISTNLNEVEFEIYNDLLKLLKNRSSVKAPNQAEILRYAIYFTKENIDIPLLYSALKKELEEEKKKNMLFEKAFIEFQNKVLSV